MAEESGASNEDQIVVHVPWGMGSVPFRATIESRSLSGVMAILRVEGESQQEIVKQIKGHGPNLSVEVERMDTMIINGGRHAFCAPVPDGPNGEVRVVLSFR